MGMMTGLRRLAKRQRVLGIIFVIVLSIGLIGSYVVFALPSEPIIPAEQEAEDYAAQQEAMQKALEEQISSMEASIEELQGELEANPDDTSLALQLGDSHYMLGETYYLAGQLDKVVPSFDEALALYQQVLAQNPQEERIHIRIANAAMYTGDMELAETHFREAINSDPDNNYVRFTYGYMLAMKDDLQGAIDQWQEILERNPDEEMAKRVNMMIEQARAAMEASQEQESGSSGDAASSDMEPEEAGE
ncbi:MAG: tetratricopeptide repeat protein [Clostridia bacterium]|nr:tetratricopeptide repeat protein [Clostridia bacterium]